MNSYIIYKAMSPSGKIYVGLTKFDLQHRIKGHIHFALKGSKLPFARAIRKYGADNIKWEIIESNLSKNKVEFREIYWIKQFDSVNPTKGYNRALGGIGFPGTQKSKDKIASTLKKYHKKPNTRFKHSRERGGKPIDVYECITIIEARGFESKRHKIVKKGKFIATFQTQIECCESLNLLDSKVCDCLSGKSYRKSHKGYMFEYSK